MDESGTWRCIQFLDRDMQTVDRSRTMPAGWAVGDRMGLTAEQACDLLNSVGAVPESVHLSSG